MSVQTCEQGGLWRSDTGCTGHQGSECSRPLMDCLTFSSFPPFGWISGARMEPSSAPVQESHITANISMGFPQCLQTFRAQTVTHPALATQAPMDRLPLPGGAGPGTCLFRNRSLPRRHSSLLSKTPSRLWGSLRQQASGTSSLSKVRSRKTDANLKSSGPLTPQQPN